MRNLFTKIESSRKNIQDDARGGIHVSTYYVANQEWVPGFPGQY